MKSFHFLHPVATLKHFPLSQNIFRVHTAHDGVGAREEKLVRGCEKHFHDSSLKYRLADFEENCFSRVVAFLGKRWNRFKLVASWEKVFQSSYWAERKVFFFVREIKKHFVCFGPKKKFFEPKKKKIQKIADGEFNLKIVSNCSRISARA